MNMEGDQLKPSIGFIGMGHMGSHIPQRLLEAGYRLTVYIYMLLFCNDRSIQAMLLHNNHNGGVL
jgi:pyrroline-5-carboxylate reductase